MPCTVTQGEILHYEASANEKRYGVWATDLAITTAVACWLGKHTRNDVAVPKYVRIWLDQHASDDRMRAATNAEMDLRRVLGRNTGTTQTYDDDPLIERLLSMG